MACRQNNVTCSSKPPEVGKAVRTCNCPNRQSKYARRVRTVTGGTGNFEALTTLDSPTTGISCGKDTRSRYFDPRCSLPAPAARCCFYATLKFCTSLQ